jgi:hypothetical protein
MAHSPPVGETSPGQRKYHQGHGTNRRQQPDLKTRKAQMVTVEVEIRQKKTDDTEVYKILKTQKMLFKKTATGFHGDFHTGFLQEKQSYPAWESVEPQLKTISNLTARFAQDAENAEDLFYCFSVRGRKTITADLSYHLEKI